MFGMAQKDLKALRGMQDAETFEEEIFGFHAQQAVEKTLKAWLSARGRLYPRSHDLEALIALLAEAGETVPEHFRLLIPLTDYAVQLRYAAFEDMGDPLDRPETVRQVKELIEYVQAVLPAD